MQLCITIIDWELALILKEGTGLKTVFVSVCGNLNLIESLISYKLLGLWVDDDLKWKSNVILGEKGCKTFVSFKGFEKL